MKLLYKYNKVLLSAAFGIAIWLFWWLCYPHALSYQEQYQLFQTDGRYLLEHLGVAGGLADYAGEAITQFYYVPCVGAAMLAMLFVVLQRLTWRLMKPASAFYLLSFLPPLLLLWLMGDESVLTTYAVALVGVCCLPFVRRGNRHAQTSPAKGENPASRKGLKAVLGRMGRASQFADLIVIPLLYWLLGPMTWLYVALRMAKQGWRDGWKPLWLLAVVLVLNRTLMEQWPLRDMLLSVGYYRVPLQWDVLMAIVPASVVVLAAPLIHKRKTAWWLTGLQLVVLALTAWAGLSRGFEKEKYELIRQDYLVRNERWDELIERARHYQVNTAFSSVSVNLALAQKRQLAESMFDFYQSGEDALIMPRYRDLTSDLPSAEAFFRLGMVNSAQRYMFDIQESILNGKKSARCTKRIVECMLVNGHYAPARKHIALLKRTLFYRHWAEEAELMAGSDVRVDAHPLLGRLRQLRFKNDFLFSYPEIEKIFGMLFLNNTDNKMALDYFMGQLLLKGSMQQFVQSMGWVQRYGGYSYMPVGYQDAMRSIQSQGREGDKYKRYVERMMRTKQ